MVFPGLYHSDGNPDHDHQYQVEDLSRIHGLCTCIILK